MVRAEVQIPDELYERATRFSHDREISLTEAVRRGLELLLESVHTEAQGDAAWVFPTFDGGETLAPLDRLKEFAHNEESLRSLPHGTDDHE